MWKTQACLCLRQCMYICCHAFHTTIILLAQPCNAFLIFIDELKAALETTRVTDIASEKPLRFPLVVTWSSPCYLNYFYDHLFNYHSILFVCEPHKKGTRGIWLIKLEFNKTLRSATYSLYCCNSSTFTYGRRLWYASQWTFCALYILLKQCYK